MNLYVPLSTLSLMSAALPAFCYLANASRFRVPGTGAEHPGSVSVLIPARNEQQAIGRAIDSVLSNDRVTLEVLVLDDHSTDDTAGQVEAIAARDDRVRLIRGAPLPAGWAGKQFACHQLAAAAKYDRLLFIDADVTLSDNAISRLDAEISRRQTDLISGIPYQFTATWLDWLTLPLIHFLLLCFLPLQRMQQSRNPAYGAGCGQLFLASADAYHGAGGHRVIRHSFHDGLTLPRAFRRAGYHTDLVDITDLADCRMYDNVGEAWNGLVKNATEGLANARLIVPATLLIVLGQILPVPLLIWQVNEGARASSLLLAVSAVLLMYLPRVLASRHFRQPIASTLLHPIACVIFLFSQWYAFARSLAGRPAVWKGRPKSAS